MDKPSILLIGAGGFARACIDAIETHGQYRIAGLIGSADELGKILCGYSVIGTDADLEELARDHHYALVAIGQVRSPEPRASVFDRVKEIGFEMPVIVAQSAYVSPHASIGSGTVVMHGAIVNAGATIGENCIINLRAVIDHDATIGDHCHISNGAVLNGAVSVGEGGFVGSGSVVKEGVVIGKQCLIGMGLSVRHNQPDFSRYLGELSVKSNADHR